LSLETEEGDDFKARRIRKGRQLHHDIAGLKHGISGAMQGSVPWESIGDRRQGVSGLKGEGHDGRGARQGDTTMKKSRHDIKFGGRVLRGSGSTSG
jgi:hypothetical protein